MPRTYAQERYAVASTADYRLLVPRLFEHAGARRLWYIEGTLGAGKTTLIQHLCAHLGIPQAAVTSPSFAIVHEYSRPQDPQVVVAYHLDLYRVQTDDELRHLGLCEYLTSGVYCFVEWPARARALTAQPACTLHVRAQDDESRTLVLQCS